MKRIYCLFLLTGFLFFFSCASDDDSDVQRGGEQSDINKFVWRAMNNFYYWQDQVDDLSDNIKSSSKYNDLISNNKSAQLFEKLLFTEDKEKHFSVIRSDYTELENLFNSVSNYSRGFEFAYIKNRDALLVLYVVKDSEAEKNKLKRGDIITKINGKTFTKDNYRNVLAQSTLRLELSNIEKTGDKQYKLIPTEKEITIHTSKEQENPIVLDTVFENGSRKIGYLFYTGFLDEYNDELNAVFSKFRSKGTNELILDLRYNGGGSVQTSTYLASMITGQFKGKVYAELRWNKKLERFNDSSKFGDEIKFYELGNNHPISEEKINHLNLNRLVVIGTRHTASASELIINGLRGVDFNVTLVGEKTYGKNKASITLYDSPDFRKKNLNPNHRYAMQPIVAKSYNAKGESDYSDGFRPDPDYHAEDIDDLSNIEQLGNIEEPMLKRAIRIIDPSFYNSERSNQALKKDKIPFKTILFSKDLSPFNKNMTIEITP